MKTINDQFREIGIYCTESLYDEIKEYVENFNSDLIEYNIEVIMSANQHVMHIHHSEHKKVGKLWKLTTEIYLSALLDTCRENADEGFITEIKEITYKDAYVRALNSKKNLRKQLGTGE